MFAINISTQNLSCLVFWGDTVLKTNLYVFRALTGKDENSVAAQNIPYSLSHLLGGMDSGE